MIAFAACIASRSKLAAFAAPGLRRAMEPDSVFAELETDRSIHADYNEALEQSRGRRAERLSPHQGWFRRRCVIRGRERRLSREVGTAAGRPAAAGRGGRDRLRLLRAW
jgi:hypothetical protein